MIRLRDISWKTTVALLLALSCTMASAAEIYRWTDENGVVHFSGTPPPAQSPDVETLALQDTRPSDWNPEADLYGVEEQAARMKALREDMEQKRQARLERQQRQASRQPVQNRTPESYGYPVYWNPGIRPPLRPMPPIERPGPGPGDPIRPPTGIRPPSPLQPR